MSHLGHGCSRQSCATAFPASGRFASAVSTAAVSKKRRRPAWVLGILPASASRRSQATGSPVRSASSWIQTSRVSVMRTAFTPAPRLEGASAARNAESRRITQNHADARRLTQTHYRSAPHQHGCSRQSCATAFPALARSARIAATVGTWTSVARPATSAGIRPASISSRSQRAGTRSKRAALFSGVGSDGCWISSMRGTSATVPHLSHRHSAFSPVARKISAPALGPAWSALRLSDSPRVAADRKRIGSGSEICRKSSGNQLHLRNPQTFPLDRMCDSPLKPP